MSTFLISDCDGNHVKGKMLMLSEMFRLESFVFNTDNFIASLLLLDFLLNWIGR